MDKDTPTATGNRSDMAYRFKFEYRMTDKEIERGNDIVKSLNSLSYGDSRVILKYAMLKIETNAVIKA